MPGSYVTLFVGRRRLIVPGKWDTGRFKMLRDALRDSWAYQEIMQEGALQEQRLTLLEVVQSRFPGIEPLAKKTVDSISDLAVLRRLIVKMSVHKRRRKLSKHFFR